MTVVKVRRGSTVVTGPGGITQSELDAALEPAFMADVLGEINALTEKATPVGTDLILIEDSGASYAKKKIQIDNLPDGFSLVAHNTVLTFDKDKEIYFDATGTSPTYTLSGTGNVNGVGILLRLNKPNGITFPANFEASPNSQTLDATKLNLYALLYSSSWDGAGTARVIYTNTLFTAI